MQQTENFEKERQLIGEGLMAKVYLWNGFAYKCFNADYPDGWIEYEIHVQSVIAETNLPIIKYYKSEFPHSIKMEYIKGVSLAERMRVQKYKNGLDDLIAVYPEIHKLHGLKLPRLNPFLLEQLYKVNVGEDVKENARKIISEIPDGDTLCHLDYHLMNLMYSDEKYYIIDWISAKIGNPIYDYARSYVIMYEFANRLSGKFLRMMQNQFALDQTELNKAIYVMALHRLSEMDTEKVRELLNSIKLD